MARRADYSGQPSQLIHFTSPHSQPFIAARPLSASSPSPSPHLANHNHDHIHNGPTPDLPRNPAGPPEPQRQRQAGAQPVHCRRDPEGTGSVQYVQTFIPARMRLHKTGVCMSLIPSRANAFLQPSTSSTPSASRSASLAACRKAPSLEARILA